MSGRLDELLQVTGGARKTLPHIHELFGNTESFPVFRDIAVACEKSARNRELAWPMRIPYPPQPPHPPDFAGLASMYCNHLGYVLAPSARDSAANAPATEGHCIDLLAFLAFAAHSYSAHLPAKVDPAGYLEGVTSALLAGMHATHPGNEPFWQIVASESRKRLEAFLRNAETESKRCSDELAHYFTTLPAVESSGSGRALDPVYQRGRRLREAFNRWVVPDRTMPRRELRSSR